MAINPDLIYLFIPDQDSRQANLTATINATINEYIDGMMIIIRMPFDTPANTTVKINDLASKYLFYNNARIEENFYKKDQITFFTYSSITDAFEDASLLEPDRMYFFTPTQTSRQAALTATVKNSNNVPLGSYTNGLVLIVKMPFDNAANTTLNINNLGTKYVYHNNVKAPAGTYKEGEIVFFVFNEAKNRFEDIDSVTSEDIVPIPNKYLDEAGLAQLSLEIKNYMRLNYTPIGDVSVIIGECNSAANATVKEIEVGDSLAIFNKSLLVVTSFEKGNIAKHFKISFKNDNLPETFREEREVFLNDLAVSNVYDVNTTKPLVVILIGQDNMVGWSDQPSTINLPESIGAYWTETNIRVENNYYYEYALNSGHWVNGLNDPMFPHDIYYANSGMVPSLASALNNYFQRPIYFINLAVDESYWSNIEDKSKTWHFSGTLRDRSLKILNRALKDLDNRNINYDILGTILLMGESHAVDEWSHRGSNNKLLTSRINTLKDDFRIFVNWIKSNLSSKVFISKIGYLTPVTKTVIENDEEVIVTDTTNTNGEKTAVNTINTLMQEISGEIKGSHFINSLATTFSNSNTHYTQTVYDTVGRHIALNIINLCKVEAPKFVNKEIVQFLLKDGEFYLLNTPATKTFADDYAYCNTDTDTTSKVTILKSGNITTELDDEGNICPIHGTTINIWFKEGNTIESPTILLKDGNGKIICHEYPIIKNTVHPYDYTWNGGSIYTVNFSKWAKKWIMQSGAPEYETFYGWCLDEADVQNKIIKIKDNYYNAGQQKNLEYKVLGEKFPVITWTDGDPPVLHKAPRGYIQLSVWFKFGNSAENLTFQMVSYTNNERTLTDAFPVYKRTNVRKELELPKGTIVNFVFAYDSKKWFVLDAATQVFNDFSFCDTLRDVQIKAVKSVNSNLLLKQGTNIQVYFTDTNITPNPLLSVNNTEPKAISFKHKSLAVPIETNTNKPLVVVVSGQSNSVGWSDSYNPLEEIHCKSWYDKGHWDENNEWINEEETGYWTESLKDPIFPKANKNLVGRISLLVSEEVETDKVYSENGNGAYQEYPVTITWNQDHTLKSLTVPYSIDLFKGSVLYTKSEGVYTPFVKTTKNIRPYGSAWPEFAVEFYKLFKRPVYIINTAVGGTGVIYTTAAARTPKKFWFEQAALRGRAIKIYRNAIAALNEAGIDYDLLGTIWIQGENDAARLAQTLRNKTTNQLHNNAIAWIKRDYVPLINWFLDPENIGGEFFISELAYPTKISPKYDENTHEEILQYGQTAEQLTALRNKAFDLINTLYEHFSKQIPHVHIAAVGATAFPGRMRTHYLQKNYNIIGREIAEYLYQANSKVATWPANSVLDLVFDGDIWYPVENNALPEKSDNNFSLKFNDILDNSLLTISKTGEVNWQKGVPDPIKDYVDEKIKFDSPHKDNTAFKIVDNNGRLLFTVSKKGAVDWEQGVPQPIKDFLSQTYMTEVKGSKDELLSIKSENNKEIFSIKSNGFVEWSGNVPDVIKNYFNQYFKLDTSNNTKLLSITDRSNKEVFSIEKNGDISWSSDAFGIKDFFEKYIEIKPALIDERPFILKDIDNKEILSIQKDGSLNALIDYPKNNIVEPTSTDVYKLRDLAGKTLLNISDKGNFNINGSASINGDLKITGKLSCSDFGWIYNWSDAESIKIPDLPSCVTINISGFIRPLTKLEEVPAEMEFWDGRGNYFKKKILMGLQGNSTWNLPKPNFKFDLMAKGYEYVDDDGDPVTCPIQFGKWVPSDSFHLKAFYTDITKCRAIISYKIWDEINRTYGFAKDASWKRAMWPATEDILNGVNAGFSANLDWNQKVDTGATCRFDAFPCIMYMDNKFFGIFAWQQKKQRENFEMVKDEANHIHIDSLRVSFLSGNPKYSEFEIRNPKKLICQDLTNYDGDTNRAEPITKDNPVYKAAKAAWDALDDASKKIKKISMDMTVKKLKELYTDSVDRFNALYPLLDAVVSYRDAYDQKKKLKKVLDNNKEGEWGFKQYYNLVKNEDENLTLGQITSIPRFKNYIMQQSILTLLEKPVKKIKKEFKNFKNSNVVNESIKNFYGTLPVLSELEQQYNFISIIEKTNNFARLSSTKDLLKDLEALFFLPVSISDNISKAIKASSSNRKPFVDRARFEAAEALFKDFVINAAESSYNSIYLACRELINSDISYKLENANRLLFDHVNLALHFVDGTILSNSHVSTSNLETIYFMMAGEYFGYHTDFLYDKSAQNLYYMRIKGITHLAAGTELKIYYRNTYETFAVVAEDIDLSDDTFDIEYSKLLAKSIYEYQKELARLRTVTINRTDAELMADSNLELKTVFEKAVDDALYALVSECITMILAAEMLKEQEDENYKSPIPLTINASKKIFRDAFEEVFDPENVIDLYIQLTWDADGDSVTNNTQCVTWGPNPVTGKNRWYLERYDANGSLGGNSRFHSEPSAINKGTGGSTRNHPFHFVLVFYFTECCTRYAYLRDHKILDAEKHIRMINDYMLAVGYDNYVKEFETWPLQNYQGSMELNKQYWDYYTKKLPIAVNTKAAANDRTYVVKVMNSSDDTVILKKDIVLLEKYMRKIFSTEKQAYDELTDSLKDKLTSKTVLHYEDTFTLKDDLVLPSYKTKQELVSDVTLVGNFDDLESITTVYYNDTPFEAEVTAENGTLTSLKVNNNTFDDIVFSTNSYLRAKVDGNYKNFVKFTNRTRFISNAVNLRSHVNLCDIREVNILDKVTLNYNIALPEKIEEVYMEVDGRMREYSANILFVNNQIKLFAIKPYNFDDTVFIQGDAIRIKIGEDYYNFALVKEDFTLFDFKAYITIDDYISYIPTFSLNAEMSLDKLYIEEDYIKEYDADITVNSKNKITSIKLKTSKFEDFEIKKNSILKIRKNNTLVNLAVVDATFSLIESSALFINDPKAEKKLIRCDIPTASAEDKALHKWHYKYIYRRGDVLQAAMSVYRTTLVPKVTIYDAGGYYKVECTSVAEQVTATVFNEERMYGEDSLCRIYYNMKKREPFLDEFFYYSN